MRQGMAGRVFRQGMLLAIGAVMVLGSATGALSDPANPPRPADTPKPTKAGDSTTVPGSQGQSDPIVIPFELLRSRHMAVQVKVNGTGPYRLVFDTGAPMNLVSNKLAREAGLLKKGERPVLPLFGMGGPKTIQTLEIGAVKLQNVPAIVMDHPTVGAMAKVLGPIEGIIGFPFFARYKTTVDYQKRELTLVPNGYEPKDVMQGLMEKLMNPPKGKPEPRILAPAALWGFQVDKANDDTQEGVTVTRVLPDSPADQAGLRPGDRLLTLDGRWTDSVADTYAAAEAIKPGQTVVVVVLRKGQRLELSITPRAGF
jgi:hypothetical protein